MAEDIQTVWDSINKRISESQILSMLVTENQLCMIDYNRYLESGYTREDVEVGRGLIDIYRTLSNYIQE